MIAKRTVGPTSVEDWWRMHVLLLQFCQSHVFLFSSLWVVIALLVRRKDRILSLGNYD